MAQEVEFRDKDETGMTLLKYDNLLLPKRWDNPPCKLEEVKNFSYKEGDVFLCSYPKTGSHWLAALVSLLLRDVDVNDASTERLPLIDMFDTETIAARPEPRATSTHLLYERLPVEHLQNKGKIILILRNPKDVIASFYHFLQIEYTVMYNGTWDYFLELFLDGNVPYGSYFDFVTSWDSAIKHHPDHEICVVFFEDLKQDSLKELRRLRDYLGVSAEDSRLQAILDRCSLHKLKEEVEKKDFSRGMHDPEGKSTVYRKGEVGDWKNQMSVADSEKVDLFIEKKFKNCSFQFRYS